MINLQEEIKKSKKLMGINATNLHELLSRTVVMKYRGIKVTLLSTEQSSLAQEKAKKMLDDILQNHNNIVEITLQIQ